MTSAVPSPTSRAMRRMPSIPSAAACWKVVPPGVINSQGALSHTAYSCGYRLGISPQAMSSQTPVVISRSSIRVLIGSPCSSAILFAVMTERKVSLE